MRRGPDRATTVAVRSDTQGSCDRPGLQSHSIPELSVSAKVAPSATAATCAEVICVLVLFGEPGAKVDVPDSEVSAPDAVPEKPRPAPHTRSGRAPMTPRPEEPRCLPALSPHPG